MSKRLRQARGWAAEHHWIWAFVACIILWLTAGALSNDISLRVLLVNATLASFLALAGVGQMVVIASGDGSFDLSLPYVITISAFLSAGVLGGGASQDTYGILAGLLVGLVVGLLNGVLTAHLKMPAIVASLATGYILYSFILIFEGQGGGLVSTGLGQFLRIQAGGASMVLAFAAIGGGIIAFLFVKTIYGRYLQGMGQSRPAAALAGIRVSRMTLANFAISGVFGAVIGILLSAYDGGAFEDIGTIYLIGSVAAVVVGGNPVTGGKCSVAATMLGALVMTLLVTVLEITQLGIGVQDVLEGLSVIVIVVASTFARGGMRRGARV
jgi:ribose transport system permease protein